MAWIHETACSIKCSANRLKTYSVSKIYLAFFFKSPNWGIIQYCTLYIHVDNWRRGSSRPDQVHQVIMISLEGMKMNEDHDDNDK